MTQPRHNGASPDKKQRKPPQPKLEQRVGPSTRKTTTGVKKARNGSIYNKPKPDKPERAVKVTKKNRKHISDDKNRSALEVQLFETVDEKNLTPLEARCLLFVREFLRCGGNMTQAAKQMGVIASAAPSVGMRYFRHEFTQKLLRDNLLDLQRDRAALGRILLQKTMEEMDPKARYQEPGSHRARVAALELAGKMLGLLEKKVTIEGASGSGPAGVILIPTVKSRDEWEAEVMARQEALKAGAVNPEVEKNVL